MRQPPTPPLIETDDPDVWLKQHRDWGVWASQCLDEDVAMSDIQNSLQEGHDHLFRQVWKRAVTTMKANGVAVPSSYVWFVMGSAGRKEAPLWTDQDHALFLGDDDRETVVTFSQRLVKGLQQAGYPRCPGRVMASEALWRGNPDTWNKRLNRWVTGSSRDDARYLMIVADARVVAGETDKVQKWRRDLIRLARQHPQILRRESDRRSRTPLNPWGGFYRERYGKHAGKVPIKEGGYLLMVDAFRLWSLALGIDETCTRRRIQEVGSSLKWSQQRVDTLLEALDTFLEFRLRNSLQYGTDTNHVDTSEHPVSRIRRLKEALVVSKQVWRSVRRDMERLAAHSDKGDRKR
ncbi:DUF294 nucleotidyltransferase-like domain-containing protein [Desmospora activa]|uniref:CBS domain-containing protein n=1 Tax=Desmospora activa DSM 45169 TaxID=1121389 RepID=A0A2T4ZAG8_9BACL|nr:DUF294 nucleotidyltransferase-like domain-containing protein [Desmospora activa]PTM58879.1 CBS domain-containing protein [Desmospora activa DSM 45169]